MTLKHLFAGTKWDVPCERCSQPLSKCACPPLPEKAPPAPAPLAPGKQQLTVRVEKRAKGKKVTVVRGLAAPDLETLAPALKALCGAGGTIKDGLLEVQGEHQPKIEAELEKRGYKVK